MKRAARIWIISVHPLILRGFTTLIEGLGYTISIAAEDEKDFLVKLDLDNCPYLLLLDLDTVRSDAFDLHVL